MLTGKDAHERPYGEMIDLGQQRMREPPYAGRVLNVSVMGGFAYADTPFNGLTVVVTATDADAAQSLAREIAEAGWARRERFRATLTVARRRRAACARHGGSHRPALIFADVADNPGGGGRGNTMWILEAFHHAGVQDALVGVIHDPALAAEAHECGEGAHFTARFNRDGGDEFSKPFSAPAVVRRLHDGTMRGRRGIYADNTLALGPCAALQLDGITVVVISNRVQCADPIFFEAFGLDIAAARVVVVKSRGHFRGGFDEFFRHEQVVEVDAPGLTSPVLSRFPWKHMPRPVLPIDAAAEWSRMKLDDLPTPCLVLDRTILQRNIATMAHGSGAPRRAAAPAHEDRQVDRRGASGDRRSARRHHRLDAGRGGVFRRPRHHRHPVRRRHHAAETRSGGEAEQHRRLGHRADRRSRHRGRDRRLPAAAAGADRDRHRRGPRRRGARRRPAAGDRRAARPLPRRRHDACRPFLCRTQPGRHGADRRGGAGRRGARRRTPAPGRSPRADRLDGQFAHRAARASTSTA